MSERNQTICFIYAVHFDETNGRHISQVKARDAIEGKIEPMRILSKSEVLKKLDSGFDVITMVKGGVDYVPGANVLAYTIDKKRYIKTAANDTEEDNLGELPTF